MKDMFITLMVLCVALQGCSKWSVVNQSEVDFKVTTAGFADENTGITVGYAGECHFTTDGGQNWPRGENESYCRFGLEIINNSAAFSCGNAGHVRFSADGGKTWQSVTDFGEMEPKQCRYLSFSDSKSGWIASAQVLAATTDQGSSWNELELPEGIGGIKAIDTWSADSGCILDNNYNLYFTEDGGRTWQQQKIQIHTEGIDKKVGRAPNTAMRFTDRNKGVIITMAIDNDETKLIEMSTTDGGKTWTEEKLPLETFESSVLFLTRNAKVLTVYDVVNGITVLKKAGT
ncbi:MAG: hypothetical protein JW822_02155 [Spirochaetales bacterium]|nr:hypothetical protein [Spirochaetales bacterium]